MDSFVSYLEGKKVDYRRFQMELPEEWERLLREFDACGAASFDQQKKFFINNLRLQFPGQEKSPE